MQPIATTDWNGTDWASTGLAASCYAKDAPMPLHLIQAGTARAQRDRMILLLVAGFALAVAATAI